MFHVVQVADVVVGIFHAGNGALCDIVVASSSGRVILLLSSISTLFLHIAHCDKGNEKFGVRKKIMSFMDF